MSNNTQAQEAKYFDLHHSRYRLPQSHSRSESSTEVIPFLAVNRRSPPWLD
ncbi:hypothetical protein P4114_31790 [Pseudomonas aeruginosa]|nr:hypothetical protein [Pseudomonas aeruginosa]